MNTRTHTTLMFLIAAGVPALGIIDSLAVADDEAMFEKIIRPMLVENCAECHGTDQKKLRGGLVLTDVASILRGGDSGPVLVPGHPEESPLYLAITYADPEFQMPPSGAMDPRDIEAVRAWIEAGAVMPKVHGADELLVQEGARSPTTGSGCGNTGPTDRSARSTHPR